MKLSRMAAGIISTNAIQLQFLLNHPSFKVRLSNNTKTIESNPQGKTRKVEGLLVWVGMVEYLLNEER